eukprot:Skav204820  [mRNA]  locus=scaffold3914:199850:203326:+ [translate_table: standard]
MPAKVSTTSNGTLSFLILIFGSLESVSRSACTSFVSSLALSVSGLSSSTVLEFSSSDEFSAGASLSALSDSMSLAGSGWSKIAVALDT